MIAASTVIAAWGVAALLFVGLGGLLPRAWRAEASLAHSFWWGFAIAVAVLQLWHFLLPVDARAWLLLGPLSVAGAFRLDWRRLLPERRPALLAAVPLVAFAAFMALRSPGNPDTCLYYMQTVRWFNAYPIVPGLGNLHYRLAYNDSYFLYVSLLDVGPFWHRSEHIANGLLLLAIAVPGAVATARMLFAPNPPRSSYLWALALGVALDQLMGGNLSSPGADAAVWALDAAVVLFTLGPLVDGNPVGAQRVIWIAALAVTGFVVKPTALFAGAPFTCLALWLWMRDFSPAAGAVRRMAATLAGLAAAQLLPWMARGLLMSGYPFFPFTFPNLGLSWRVPESIARREAAYAAAYARFSRNVDFMHGPYRWRLKWLGIEWLDDRDFLFPFGAAALAGLLLAVLTWRDRRVPRELPGLIAGLASIGLWFELAPDPRFFGPCAWLFAGLNVLAAYQCTRPPLGWVGRLPLVLLVFCVQLGAFAGGIGGPLPRTFEPGLIEKSAPVRLPSGDVVQEDRGCCLELPCTPDAGPVRMRRPGDLRAGFYSALVTPDAKER